MIGNAIALSVLSTAGFYIIFAKLPKRIRDLVQKYYLLSDILALIGVYILFGGTLTALFAGALSGLFVSILLKVANSPEEFLYIYDARTWLQEQFKNTQTILNQYGKQYRERRLANV